MYAHLAMYIYTCIPVVYVHVYTVDRYMYINFNVHVHACACHHVPWSEDNLDG